MDSETADLDFLKNLTILYVEDEDDAFNHSLELLSRFCNSVVTARNGEEGLAAYAFNQPDIVITDIRMPKVDGLEMAAGIRAQNSSVSIIVMTAFEQANYLKRSIDIGIDAYVSKPLNFKQFYRSLLSSAHRLRVERQLLESTELFSKLTEQAPGMVFQYRLFPDGRHFFPYASKAINSLFGLKPEEVRSDASAAFARVHPDDLNNLLEATIESARQLKVCVSEFRVLHPEQGERWLSSNARPERLADGSTVWHGFMSDITVTKELYRALEAQEQFTSSTINGLNAHICVIDANGSIMRTNKAWNDFAAENGAPAESCGVGANYLETCLKSCASDEPDIRYFVDAIRSVTSGAAAAFCMEYPCHSPTTKRWFMCNINPFQVNGIKYAIISHENITERKLAELKISASNNTLNDILETMSDRVWEVDLHGRYTFCSPTVEKHLGYTPDEMLGKTFFDLMPLEEARRHRSELRYVVQNRAHIANLENWNFHKDGSPVLLLTNGAPIFDYNGNLTGYRGVDTNITRIRLYEEELLKLSYAVDQSPVSIVITDLRGIITFVNDAFTRLTGYTAKEAIGQNPRMLKSDRTRPEEINSLWSALTKGETWTGELVNRRKDGSLFTEQLSVSVLHNVRGERSFYLGIATDITDKKIIIDELSSARLAADAASWAKSEFLANMSHEIRTPMNGVMGMAQLLELTDLTVEQRDYVASLQVVGKNLLRLVNDILNLSKIESGKMDLESTEFDLSRAIDDVYSMQKSVAFQKRLKLGVKISGDLPQLIIGDQLRVKQIILNLLGNAIKFTAEGSITIAVNVVDTQYRQIVTEISVTDSGIGIAAEAFEDIFKPFSQEDASITRKFGGTGLGLTICKRLAELMGGDISVESTQGVGSCFKLTLPFSLPSVSEAGRLPGPALRPLWDLPPLRILFVEDNPVNTKFGVTLLGKFGHEVVAVENGSECLTALETGTFDLVLMDIRMPVMNGEDALCAIRRKEQGSTHHQLVIALTGNALHGEKKHYFDVGFDGYVSKPLEQIELVSEMKRVIGLRTLPNPETEAPS